MKKLYSLMLLCAAIIFATGCSKDDDNNSTPTPVSVSGVTLDKTTLSIEVGGTSTLIATVSPDNAADKSVAWSSDKTDIATVTDAGVVAGVAVGTATITVTSADGEKVATCQVTVTAKAITWAEDNLVANGDHGAKVGKSTDGGLYFQFGSLVGWSTTGSPTVAVSPADYTGGTSWNSSWTGDSKISATDDAVSGKGDPCRYYLGDPWRLPTKDEYEELFKNQTEFSSTSSPWKWENASATNNTKNLTFPASGFRSNYDGSLDGVGTAGCFWSASPNDASRGYHLYFGSSFVYPSNYNSRALGLPVRCVK